MPSIIKAIFGPRNKSIIVKDRNPSRNSSAYLKPTKVFNLSKTPPTAMPRPSSQHLRSRKITPPSTRIIPPLSTTDHKEIYPSKKPNIAIAHLKKTAISTTSLSKANKSPAQINQIFYDGMDDATLALVLELHKEDFKKTQVQQDIHAENNQPIPSLDEALQIIKTSGSWHNFASEFAINYVLRHAELTGQTVIVWEDPTFSPYADQPFVFNKTHPSCYAWGNESGHIEKIPSNAIHICRRGNHYEAVSVKAHTTSNLEISKSHQAITFAGGEQMVLRRKETAHDGDCFYRSILSGMTGKKPTDITADDIQQFRLKVALAIQNDPATSAFFF